MESKPFNLDAIGSLGRELTSYELYLLANRWGFPTAHRADTAYEHVVSINVPAIALPIHSLWTTCLHLGEWAMHIAQEERLAFAFLCMFTAQRLKRARVRNPSLYHALYTLALRLTGPQRHPLMDNDTLFYAPLMLASGKVDSHPDTMHNILDWCMLYSARLGATFHLIPASEIRIDWSLAECVMFLKETGCAELPVGGFTRKWESHAGPVGLPGHLGWLPL